jgi:hypothetical protein
MLRRILGFSVGFFATLALIVLIVEALGASKAAGALGPLIIPLAGAIGMRTARWFASPKEITSGVTLNLRPLRDRWWRLEEGLRLCIVVGAIWAIGAYVLQIDRWQPDLKLVFVPPIALVALYFAYQKLVKGERNAQDGRLRSPEE